MSSMTSAGTGHSHQPSVANAASLFGSSGGDDNHDPFASIGASQSPTSGLSAFAEQEPTSPAIDSREFESTQAESAHVTQDGSSAFSHDLAIASPTKLFGESSYSSGDDWLVGSDTTAAGEAHATCLGEGCVAAYLPTEAVQATYDPNDSNSWYVQSKDQQQYAQYDFNQAGHYYDYNYSDNTTNRGSAYDYSQPPQQKYGTAEDQSGWNVSMMQNSSQYDYDAPPPSQSGQYYGHYYQNGLEQRAHYDYSDYSKQHPAFQDQFHADWSQEQCQQNSGDPHLAHTSNETCQDSVQIKQYDYDSQAYQSQQQGAAAAEESWNPEAGDYHYDKYATPGGGSILEEQANVSQDFWNLSVQGQHQRSVPPSSEVSNPFVSRQAVQPDAGSYEPFNTVQSLEAAHGPDQFASASFVCENSCDAQLHATPTPTDPYAPQGSGPSQYDSNLYSPSMRQTESFADDADANSEAANYAATTSLTSPPPPSSAAPKTVPPSPKGLALSTPKNAAKAVTSLASEKSTLDAAADNAAAPSSLSLRINGFFADNEHGQHHVAASLSDYQRIPGSASHPFASSLDQQESIAITDNDEVLVAPPRTERQSTPKLILTGEDEDTTELDTTTSELSAGDGDGEGDVDSFGKGSLLSHSRESHTTSDQDLDDAAREFSELQLTGKMPAPSTRRRNSIRSTKNSSPYGTISGESPSRSEAAGVQSQAVLEAFDENVAIAPSIDDHGPEFTGDAEVRSSQDNTVHEAYENFPSDADRRTESLSSEPPRSIDTGSNLYEPTPALAYGGQQAVSEGLDRASSTYDNSSLAQFEPDIYSQSQSATQTLGVYNPYAPSSDAVAYESPSDSSYEPSGADPYAPLASQTASDDQPSAAVRDPQSTLDPYAPSNYSYAPSNPYAPLGDGGGGGKTSQSHQNFGDPAASSAYDASLSSADTVDGINAGWGYSARDDVLDTLLTSQNQVYEPAGTATNDLYPPNGGHAAHTKDYSQQPSAYEPQQNRGDQYSPTQSRAIKGTYFTDQPAIQSEDGPTPYDVAAKTDLQSYLSEAPDVVEEKRNAFIPLVSFGVDGKLVTFFPIQELSNAPQYGYIGGDASPPTKLSIRQLCTIIPPTSFASSFNPLTFPGPAFESTAAASAIVRATGAGGGVSAVAKAKKTALITYLKEAAEEMSAGMSYRKRRGSSSVLQMSAGQLRDDHEETVRAARKTEDRLVLIRLLSLILEHDGNTVGNSAFDSAVQALLQKEDSPDPQGTNVFAPSLSNASGDSTQAGKVLHSYTITSEHLKQIREMLAKGHRKRAVDFAVDKKLWAHAMIVSSAVDQDTWRRVASQFIEHEFNIADLGDNGDGGLRLAYGLFSGQDPSSIYNLFRPSSSYDPKEPSSRGSARMPDWRTSASMILANRCVGDAAALTAMGDGLLVGGWQEAAHMCYLLAPRTSPVGGVDALDVRMALLGAQNPVTSADFVRDLDHFILSEIHEFTHSLVPTQKGQDVFAGFPHLQAYRLVHAWQLAELGETKRAQKYCEAIAGVIKASKHSPYFHRSLINQVKELSDRLVGGPQLDSGGNWVTRKIQRPTLDGMLSAFEGRFAKFIAGDDDPGIGAVAGSGGPTSGGKSRRNSPGGGVQAVGAFSHFSAITPDAMSGGISRVESFADFYGANSRPVSRAQSSAGFRQASSSATSFAFMQQQQQQQQQQQRNLSATPLGSYNDPYAPSGTNSTTGAEWGSERRSKSPSVASPTGYGGEMQRTYNQSHDPFLFNDSTAPWPKQSGPLVDQQEPHYQGPTYGYDASSDVSGAPKPQFISNLGTDLSEADNGAGLVSPMDAFAASAPTISYGAASQGSESQGRWQADDEDDDLGFGNTSHKKKEAVEDDGARDDRSSPANFRQKEDGTAKQAAATSARADSAKKPELKSSSSTSWLGRLWGRKDPNDSSTPRAAQAHMGEESAFYYDKELKRWVNKKAGDTGSVATMPPAPPRATTPSPSMNFREPGNNAFLGRPLAAPLGRLSSVDGASVEGGPPPAVSSAFAATDNAQRGTPPISEAGDALSSTELSPPASLTGRAPVSRTRSNLGDLNQPAAVQASMRPSSTTGMPPPHPPGGPVGRAGGKKKPISSRYVRVD